MLDEKSKILIDLPQIDDSVFETTSLKDNFSFIYLGRAHDTEKRVVSYNNRYLSFKELNNIRYDFGHHGGRLNNYIFIDSSSKMKDIEYLLLHFRQNNNLKISLVNDISIQFNKKNGFFFEYHKSQKNLMPFPFSKDYVRNHQYNSNSGYPPPPPPYPRITNYRKPKIIKLIKNELFGNDTLINNSDLKIIIENCITEGLPIISLFDLESDYASFLEMTAIINSIYHSKRDELSLKTYNQNYDELEIKNKRRIRNGIPIRHFWNYSIPHFEKILEEDGTFYGLEID